MAKEVLNGKLNNRNSIINMSELPAGFYILQTENKKNVVKLIK